MLSGYLHSNISSASEATQDFPLNYCRTGVFWPIISDESGDILFVNSEAQKGGKRENFGVDSCKCARGQSRPRS